MSDESERKFEEARRRKPIRTVITEAGHGPRERGSWSSFACPFCKHPTAAGVHAKAGPELFRCHNTGGKKHIACPSSNRSLDEVGFLAVLMGSSRKDAFRLYLQQAGLWEEGRERLGPSTLPGSRPRKVQKDVEPPPEPETDPAEGSPAPEIFSPDDIAQDIPSGSDEPPVPAVPAPGPTLDPAFTAPPLSPVSGDEVAELPPPPPESSSGAVAGSLDEAEEPEGEFQEDVELSPTRPGSDPNVFTISAAEISEWLAKDGGVVPGAIAPATAPGTASAPMPAKGPVRSRARVVVTGDEVGEALRWFYSRLVWRSEDVAAVRLRRGLETHTQRVAGLRANRFENLGLLQAMHVPGSVRFPLEVLLKAGLWERAWDARPEALNERHFPDGFVPQMVEGCHPARNFFGYSLKGTERGRDGKKHPVYAWDQSATLIPYFDWLPAAEEPLVGFAGVAEGEFKALAWWQIFAEDVEQMPDPDVSRLITLRPHKHFRGGASPNAYLLPPTGGVIQWHGRRREVGVASLPGITYGRKRGGTWATRHELDEWLRLTQAEVVCVVFDSEEKGDPDLPRYQPEVEARFDSVTWGLALARSLGRDRTAGLVELPEEWRDQQGKADWDGVLGRMLRKKWPNAEVPHV